MGEHTHTVYHSWFRSSKTIKKRRHFYLSCIEYYVYKLYLLIIELFIFKGWKT